MLVSGAEVRAKCFLENCSLSVEKLIIIQITEAFKYRVNEYFPKKNTLLR